MAKVAVTKLKPFPGNARRGNVELIQASLRENGQYKPLVVQKSTSYVLAGNHTLLAAIAEGYDEVDVHWIDCDDERARKINLIDNKANDEAGYDNEALAKLLEELQGDYTGTGFAQPDLDKLLDSLETKTEKADKVPVGNLAPRVSEGDIWVLGQHRLICGSSLEPGTLAIVMNGEMADLVVTSPPYNQNLDSFKPSGMGKDKAWKGWVERMGDAYSDSLPEPEYQDQQRTLLENLAMVCKDGASLFYNHKIRYRDKAILHPFEWLPFISGGPTDWRIRQEIVWDRKVSITMNARMFIPRDERIIWLTKGDEFTFNDETEIKSWGTVWEIAPKIDIAISAPFPVELPTRCIRACSARGDIVLEPYGGSGTTLIACEQLDRKCRIVEFNPQYCDVILSRWEAFTGQTAYLEGTEPND